MKLYDNISRIIDGVGLIFGIANIQEILGIIVLVLTIFNILSTYIIKIVSRIKNKEYDKIGNDTQEAIDELNKIKEKEGKKDE